MYIALDKQYALRGWQGLPYALVNTENGHSELVSADAFALLEFLDGSFDMAMVSLNQDQKQFLDELLKLGVVRIMDHASPIAAWQQYRKSRAAYISGVHWSIAGRCNLKCRHCYMSAPSYKHKEADTEGCRKIIEQLEEANVLSVSITGGEPLVRPDFWEIIDTLRQAHIYISQIYTNGLLVDDDFLAAYQKRSMKADFVLSYDCVNRHDWIRGVEGTEEKTLHIIRRLCREGYKVAIETALHRGNIKELIPAYELLRDLGVSYWKTSAIIPTGEWIKQKQADLPIEVLYESYEKLVRLYMDDGQPMSLQLDGFYGGKKGGGSEIPYMRNKGTVDMHSCLTCRTHPYILPTGKLLPCPSLTDTFVADEMPNLLEDNLADIYSNRDNPFFKTANIRTREILNHNPACSQCKHAAVCGGGCRAAAVYSGNGIYGHDNVICRFYKEGYAKYVNELIEGIRERRMM